MLTAAFYWLVNLSLAGSVAGLAVLLLRPLRAIPRRVIYPLWILPLLRFCIPAALPWQYSLYRLFSPKTLPAVGGSVTSNFMQFAASYDPFAFESARVEQIFRISAILWLCGACLAIGLALTCYIAGKREMRGATRLCGRVWRSQNCRTPVVLGIFRPKLLLPAYLKGDVGLIFLHERVHIRRGDNLWRMLAIFICCFHWFNPLIWLFLRCFLTDLELSCDETVLRACGDSRKKEYASALLRAETGKALFASQFAGTRTGARVKRILSYRKLTVFSCISLLLFALALAAALLTNPGF